MEDFKDCLIIAKIIEALQNSKLKIEILEIQNESLTNRIRILEENFERMKKAQLERYFEYSTTEELSSDDIKVCDNSDCSECQKDKYY